ncbi:leucine-rich repeat protein [Cryobacterium sp. M91]|uniref:leucine-rich repeat protein n=1 Tax=Cryobacterium sp. M91 TaxID=2048294 RepID=UPI00130500A1|nr:leucine-rich repeat protein [Cryobacterium sp. M91]
MLVLVSVLAASVLIAAPAQAAMFSFTENGITYLLNDATHTATTTAYSATATKSVVIPSSVTPASDTAYAVTVIGDSSFRDKSLTSVSIPGSVITISNSAFMGNLLGSVVIPSSVTSIAFWAFYGAALTSVTLNQGLRTIGDNAFQNNSLASVDIPASVTSIGIVAFNSNRLTSVTLHEGLVTVGGWSFGGNLLTSMTFPSTVTNVGMGAFGGNSLLASVTFAGAAPTTISPLTNNPSLGNAAGLTVHYKSAFGVVGGFTSPTWQGYASAVVVDPIVSFDLNGHGTAVAPRTVTMDGPVGDLPAPSALGWTFDGWFTDTNLTVPFASTQLVTANQTVYAKWTVVDPIVSFDLNGHGTAVAPRTVTMDGPVGDLPAPSASGWTFDGWFTDTNLTVPFASTQLVTANQTVYAKWTVVDAALTLDLGLAVGDAVAGSTVTVSGVGLLAGSAYTVIVRSTPMTIAFGSAGLDGTFSGSGVMPSGLAAGAHTVTFSGTAADGSPISNVTYFSVSAAGVMTYLSDVKADAVPSVSAAASVSALASTGFVGAPFGIAALLLLLAGAALVVGRRRVAA